MNEAAKVSLPIYSIGQIALASILGSPLAGTWLLARNYGTVGEKKKEKLCVIYGMGGTVALLALAFVIPDSVPHSGTAVVGVVVTVQIARQAQGAMIADHQSSGGKKGSWWAAAGIGIICLIVILVVVEGINRVFFW